jgi:DNA-binding SARP family transcriptional activator
MGDDGEPPPWVMSLRPVFEDRFARFAQSLAIETGRHGAYDASRQLADAVITMCPEDVGACLTYTAAAKRLEKWAEAGQAIERTQSALTTQALETPAVLVLEYADVLSRLGRRTRAVALYESLAVAATDPGITASAKERLLEEH